MWSGEIVWFHRDGSGRSDRAKIVGSERDNQVVFEYTWDGVRCVAEFNKRTGRGSARHVEAPVFANFTGHAHKPSEDQVEMQGGTWSEDGYEYGWKADLGDY